MTDAVDSRRFLITIDVGLKNMGLCVIDLIDPTWGPLLEASNLLAPKDGKVYAKYTEGICDELVFTWLHERWEYFREARVVVIEKQMTEMISMNERACVVIETALKSMLRILLHNVEGPFYCVMHAVWWKSRAGIEVGNNEIQSGEIRIVKGVVTKAKRNPCYNKHKLRSLVLFNDLVCLKDQEAMKLRRKYPEMTTDMTEAYLMGRAARDNLDDVMLKAKTFTNHNAALTTGGGQKSLSKKRRFTGLTPFPKQSKCSP